MISHDNMITRVNIFNCTPFGRIVDEFSQQNPPGPGKKWVLGAYDYLSNPQNLPRFKVFLRDATIDKILFFMPWLRFLEGKIYVLARLVNDPEHGVPP
jgi:hypothetical protein